MVGRRRLLVLAGAVVVAAGGVTTWLVLRPTAEAASTTVVAATSSTQRQTVSATGTIEPAARADLNFAVTGEVTAVLVAEGDQVTAGQALATVDDTLLTAQLAAAESQLDAAEDQQDEADSDDASVAAAESDVAAAREAVDQATLTSTIDGTVAAGGLAVGDRVGESGGQADPDAEAQFTIVSAKTFVVEANVGSADVVQVKAGLAVDITPVGAGEPVAGTVRTVGLVAAADESGAATFPVTVDVTGERDDIYAGSSATVVIVVSERPDVLTVPSMALHTDGDKTGGTTYVYKIDGEQRVRTDIEVGEAFGPLTEIVSGLAEGDQVEVPSAGPTGGSGGRSPGGGVFPGGNGGMVPGGGFRPKGNG